VDLFGIRLIGANSDTLTKAALTLAAFVALSLARATVVGLVRVVRRRPNDRIAFWTRQGSSLAVFLLLLAALLSIWFDDPKQAQTVIGLVTAGLAIAAQRVVTAFAGYLVIMRGKTFTVGDRIKMGGVQGDVVALGFLQTRILEMGQPPEVNEQEQPGMWVKSRQFSGRIVTVTNDKVFDEAVYNFTREFPFIWDEMRIGIGFKVDHARAEEILLAAAAEATHGDAQAMDAARAAVQRRYGVALDAQQPRVYWRLTDNWLEMTVRFLVPDHGIREIKDRMTRRILPALNDAGIEIASTTFEVTSVPPLRMVAGGQAAYRE
jgi:small-conductance mechanosensitive channel